MSMLGMLGKVAMGIMVAKTVGKALGGGSGGGISDMLGGLLGGSKGTDNQASQGNKLPDLMGKLGDSNSSGLGDLLGNVLSGGKVEATPDQEKQAEIILKAMINAAKADGEIDAEEQRKITKHLGDVSTEELELVRQIMKEPQDLPSLISSVPAGMEQQVYLMSLLAINLDSKPEAQYLDQFAKGLNINEQQCNEIHTKLGVPSLYG